MASTASSRQLGINLPQADVKCPLSVTLVPSLGLSSAWSLPCWGYLQDLSGLLDHLLLWAWCFLSIEFTWIWLHFKELRQSPQAIQCNFLRKQNKKQFLAFLPGPEVVKVISDMFKVLSVCLCIGNAKSSFVSVALHLPAAPVLLQRWVLLLLLSEGQTPAGCGRSQNKKGNWYPAAITALTSWSPLLGSTSKPSLDPFCTFPFLFHPLFPFLVDFDIRTANAHMGLVLGLHPPAASHLQMGERALTPVTGKPASCRDKCVWPVIAQEARDSSMGRVLIS